MTREGAAKKTRPLRIVSQLGRLKGLGIIALSGSPCRNEGIPAAALICGGFTSLSLLLLLLKKSRELSLEK